MKQRVVAALLFFLAPTLAYTQPVLNLESYLEQVRSQHQGYKGSLENRRGADERSAEADLITSFRIEGNYEIKEDKKLSDNPMLTYDRMSSESYSLGIAKTTSFGLDAKLSYDIDKLEYINPNMDLSGFNPISNSTPTLTMTQSLWQNGFGRLTQAQVEASRAQAEFEKEDSQAELDALIQKASTTYWNLVLQREIVEIQKEALKQSQALYDYNVRRSRMNLADRADTLQSKATLESKKLDLQAALDNEEMYIRELNLYRNRPSAENPGPLQPVDWTFVSKIKVSEKGGDRADTKAAKAQVEVTAANLRVTEESNKPVFDLYGSYALNGRANNYGDAMSDAYSANRPTTTVGVKLSMPLDFGSVGKATSGAKAQANAAKMIYQQKALDQEANWIDLKERLITVQRRVQLSESIVKAENEKLQYERRRLKEGRTSTYQVLLSEQDYINAHLTRVQNASELISIISEIRLYEDSDKGGSQ